MVDRQIRLVQHQSTVAESVVEASDSDRPIVRMTGASTWIILNTRSLIGGASRV